MGFKLVQEELDDLKNIKNPQILFIGDSYFQLWRQWSLYQDYSFFDLFDKETSLNIGVGSTKYKDWTILLDEIKNFPKFHKIVINLGFNDIHHTETTTAEEVFSDYKEFLTKLRTIFPTSIIYVMTVVVSPLYFSIRDRINYFNSLLISTSDEYGVKIIDNASNIDYYHEQGNCFVEDGMHLNLFGHIKMSELILDEINKKEDVGTIFSIEEFSTFDGPGIRTTIFLKGCPLHCEWCHNPEGQSFKKQYIRSPNGCLKCNKCLDLSKQEQGQIVLTKESKDACPRNLIKLCGEDKSVDELVNLILKNEKIYKMNNGGVTFSGGEPTSQYDFLLNVLKKLKGRVNTAIQTSGYINPNKWNELLKYVDYVLFDIKILDKEEHIKRCGVSNEIILKNYELLVKSKINFITRTPLIPVLIDNRSNLEQIAKYISSLGVNEIELLPYNKYAGSKYSWLLKEYEFDKKYVQEEQLDYQSIFDVYNVKVKIL